ncbi:MAG TPA: diguanylate cyclase [Anaerolineales bacterium]|nr:diguanylate cyclase [Anaerolineales bacterium]
MEVKLYLRMLQRSWWIIVITTLATLIAALVMAYLTPPTYQATARFIVSPSPTLITGGSNLLNSLSTLDKRSIITTYAEILNSQRIYNDTISLLQLNNVDLSEYHYRAVALPDANIIEFSVTGPDRDTVYTLTNGIGQRAVEYVHGLYQVYELSVLDAAVPPTVPISPQPLRSAGVALVVGLALGVVLALIREMMRTPFENFIRQRNIDDLSGALNRRAFEQKLSEVAFASPNDFSLCVVHLNGLTDYINALPQSTLQRVLQGVTRVLRNQLRGNDLVGRWSDVDFIVLLSDTPGNAAMNTMERVRMALSYPVPVDVSGEELLLDPQIGIAEYRVGDTPQTMIKNIQWALDVAKKNNGMYLLKATQPI